MSDEYGQIGPEKLRYSDDLDHIASLLTKGLTLTRPHDQPRTVDVLFTARSTAKHVVLVLMDSTVIYDARPNGLSDGSLFVGINEGKAAWMPMQWLHWSYVAQYLGQSWGDGDTDHPFADFLNSILARLGVVMPETAVS